jgi:hypothetical protein
VSGRLGVHVQQCGYGIKRKEAESGHAYRRHNVQHVPCPAGATAHCSTNSDAADDKQANLCMHMKMEALTTSFIHSAVRTTTIGLNGREPARLLA